MLRNYLRVALRNMRKHRTISLINLCGLTISVALVILLFLYIRKEQSYDAFHKNGDRLYRLEMTELMPDVHAPKKSMLSFLTRGDDQDNWITFPLVVGPAIQQHFPEVARITRYRGYEGDMLIGGQVYKEKGWLIADSNFFQTFSFPLLRGSAAEALSRYNHVVLSASTARRYFGNADPIGKTFSFVNDSTRIYTVGAVAADAPANSGLTFDVVLPTASDPDYAELIQGFNQADNTMFIELKPGVSPVAFGQRLDRWAQTYFAGYAKDWGDTTGFHLYLRPLKDVHYSSIARAWGHYTDAKRLYELSCLVLVILAIAALNYILLTVSGAAARSREVGVRKAMGAGRRSVLLQFWVETQVTVCLAVAAGWGLAFAMRNPFNGLMDAGLTPRDFAGPDLLLMVPLLCLALGLLAGYYPAWLLARAKAVSVMQSTRTFRINPRFSRIVVVVQYTCCVILMTAAFVLVRQLFFIDNKDLGFDKDQVLQVSNPLPRKYGPALHDDLAVFAAGDPSIKAFSVISGGLNGASNMNGFQLNGEQKWRRSLTVDYGYFQLMGIPVVDGRLFSPSFPTDTVSRPWRVVVNQTLFRMLGKTAKIGEYNKPLDEVIIGVVRDYNTSDLTVKLEPEEHRLNTGNGGTFLFKLRPGQSRQAIDRLEKHWKTVAHGYPFSYTFLDDSLHKMYEAQEHWERLILLSALFAVFIACMGLFGLSALNAANRTKEVGIRKVLGAGVGRIVWHLSGSFLGMVVLALALGLPIAWWLMNGWLDDFAYRIDMDWWMGAAVGLAAIAIALFTVSFQSYRAATANPVDSLRSE